VPVWKKAGEDIPAPWDHLLQNSPGLAMKWTSYSKRPRCCRQDRTGKQCTAATLPLDKKYNFLYYLTIFPQIIRFKGKSWKSALGEFLWFGG